MYKYLQIINVVMAQILSISSPKIESCTEVAKYLHALDINCHVVYNNTVIDGDIETGCNIVIPGVEKKEVKKLWPCLKKRYDLRCAHVSNPPVFSGCVYDYIRETDCPGPSS